MNENFAETLRFWAQWHPDRAMVRCDGDTITWSEFDVRTNELAAGLAAQGVGKGDSVAILMQSRVEFLEAIAAAFKLGAITVPLNQRWTATELLHPIQDSDAKVLLTEPGFADRVEDIQRKADAISVFVVDGDLEATGRFEDLYVRGAGPADVEVGADDPMFLCYTSGTTGFPKGAVLTHGSVRAAGEGKAWCDGVTWNDRVLCHAPLAMTAGCVTLFAQGCLVTGATLVLVREFDPALALDLIENERISLITGVPVFLQMMIAQPDFDQRDLSSLKWITTGGASVPLELIAAWQARGVSMTQAYGLTEASGGCVYLNGADAARKIGFAGVPIMQTRLRIVDTEGKALPANEVGEILVQGPGVMKEYRNRPEETAAALAGGWLHTGDLGLLDEDGFLKVVDRKKDMIISGGINVYPAEIERALASVPGIGDFAIIGVPDDKWGEVPMLVVADTSSLDLAALQTSCASELADYKRPRFLVDHREPLPRNVSGKILKPSLRERYHPIPADAVDLKSTSPTAPSPGGTP